MDKQEIINKAHEVEKKGFVVVWTKRPGKELSGMTTKTAALINSIDAMTQRGIEILDIASPGGVKDRSQLNEQVAAYLAIQEERTHRQREDNELDEQFWRRDA